MDLNETNKIPEEVELEGTLSSAAESVPTDADAQTEPESTPTPSPDETETAETPAGDSDTDETPEEPLPAFSTKEEVVEYFKSIASSTLTDVKERVDALKQTFYKIHKQEVETAKRLWAEAGNAVETFATTEDSLEVEFKSLLTSWREKRAEHHAEQEKTRQDNLAKKLQVVENIRLLTESTEDIGRNYPEFRRLQLLWKEIGPVPQEQVNELWKNYQVQVERFYDLLKINNEFKEYDFKKNLEIKTALCDAAEKLSKEADVVVAFRQLQKLHEEWRETGPVAKEYREDIWNRFKAASATINKNHQGFFERLKGVEAENLEKKTAICESLESMDLSQLKTYKDWDAKTTEVLALQEQWKTIGFAPKKVNVKIFERFRAACDHFFQLKSEFYKSSKDVLNQNLEKKKALCEKAEALKESTDWKTTSDALIQIQKEWKTIGPVPKKFSDSIWKRFIAACDFFFEQKEKNAPSTKNEEHKNLSTKKELIQQIEEITESMPEEEAVKRLHELTEQWNNTGHVPFKEKDKIYKAWHEAVDKISARLHIDRNSRRLNHFHQSLEDKSQGRVLHERERLLRQFDGLTNEIKTSENNIGFFTMSSKSTSGNKLLEEMRQKIEALKEERDVIYKKIKMIDEQL
jgi:hypothetical protein